MPDFKTYLELERCPHCSIDKPSLVIRWQAETNDHDGQHKRFWAFYSCARCGGFITVASKYSATGFITEIYPNSMQIDKTIPTPAYNYLEQALNSMHAPSGAVMLTASAIDAMLKSKGYTEGSLYERIKKATGDHLITEDMAQWAHEVRLEANEQRHVDTNMELPSSNDASRILKFALALGNILFTLPSQIKRGLEEAKKDKENDVKK